MHIPIKNFFRVMAAVILTVTLMGCEAEEAASNKLKDLDFTVVGEGDSRMR